MPAARLCIRKDGDWCQGSGKEICVLGLRPGRCPADRAVTASRLRLPPGLKEENMYSGPTAQAIVWLLGARGRIFNETSFQ